MIFDDLRNAQRYAGLHAGLARGLALAASADWSSFALGRQEIDGERLFVIVAEACGVGREAAKLESHRRYVDIQMATSGVDEIGWRPRQECRHIADPYQSARDIEFYADLPQWWFHLKPGQFAVFFPEDAHAPLAGTTAIRKAVLKVQVD